MNYPVKLENVLVFSFRLHTTTTQHTLIITLKAFWQGKMKKLASTVFQNTIVPCHFWFMLFTR